MKPISISEELMFNTVRLVSHDGSSGTGYFYHFNIDGAIVPVIISNKHVVNNLHLGVRYQRGTLSVNLTQ